MATAALTSVPLRTRTLSWRGRTTARVAGVLVARCRSGARHNHPKVRQLMSGQAWAPRPGEQVGPPWAPKPLCVILRSDIVETTCSERGR
jgi:hypothetical protein